MKEIKITLRITIFLALSILLFVSSVILITISVVMGRSSVNNVLDNLINNVSISVTEKTLDFLEPATMASRTRYFLYNNASSQGQSERESGFGPQARKTVKYFDKKLLSKYGLTRDGLTAMIRPRMARMSSFIDFSSDLCRSYDQISKIHNTDYRNKDFTMVKRMDDGSLSTTWRMRFNTKAGPVLITVWDHHNDSYYDADYVHPKTGRKINYANAIEPAAGAYDPGQRPWFSLAVKEFNESQAANRDRMPTWTPAYVFFSDQTPGITCSIALGRKTIDYIYCIDIGIIDISTKYLANLNVGTNGRVFILNEIGEIIAYNPYSKAITDPVKRETFAKDELSKLIRQIPKYNDPSDHNKVTGYDFKLTSIHNCANDLYRISFEKSGLATGKKSGAEGSSAPEIQLKQMKQFRFSYKGTPFIGSFSPFPANSNFRWIVGIVIPEDDFMAIAKQNTLILVIVSLFMMALSFILALWISKSITLNLKALVNETEKIRVFNLDDPVTIDSRLIEINQMGEAFHNMETGLRSFSKYVPQDVVRFVVQSGSEAILGGENKILTVFFSDIADFTAISESLTPDDLVHYLGNYLSEMSNIILNNNGTIDKYIGDAIMAFWNAPNDCEDHAFMACKTALECTQRLRVLRETTWRETGHPLFMSRFGINTGELIVGNMGSDKRLNYTVIGDTVNLASRLEGINKQYGTSVICSDNTYQLLGGRMETRMLDVVTVKGKKEPIAIYEIAGLSGEVPETIVQCFRKYEQALQIYMDRRFTKAMIVLSEILASNPRDEAARVLMKRCERFEQNPPGPDWNRVFEMREK